MNIDIRKRLEDIAKDKIPNGFVYLNYSIFPINWQEVAFGDVFEFNGSMSASRNDLSDKGIAYLHYGDIHKSSRTYINFDEEYELLPKLNISEENIKSNALLENGDIVFADASEDYECIGKSVVVYKLNNERFISGLHTIIARSKPGFLDDGFKRFFISEWSIRKQIMRYATGISVYGITKSNLGKVKMCIPNINEQQKIANILSTWDKAIELKEKLIKEKKKQKSGLMQKLLTRKVRLSGFDGEWDFTELSDVCDKVTRCIDKPNEPYYRLGLRSHAKGTFHEYVENPDDNSMDKLYIVKENDLIVNITFAWEHAIALAGSDDDGKLVSHRFPTYLFKENAEPRFYKHYVMQAKFKKMLDDISPGGAGRNRVMNQKSFLKLMVHVPSLVEQRAIADVLDLINKEISLHQGELDSLKQQKKGLMQLLLTGIVRVNVETN